MTLFEYLEMQKTLVKDINSILSKYGVKNEINLSDITITDNLVSDLVKEDKVLSNSIVESIWPSIDSLTVYHYTSKYSAESILNSGEFRLYSLLKRFDEQEIKSFCENHKLNGYLEHTNGVPKYKTLIMSNMYYASFTDTNLTVDQEQYFWNVFAPIDGVRLKLKVTASNPNFRKMVYEKTKGKPLELLSDLSQCIKSKYDKNFILAGISRLCAFYLAKEFDVENEYRALYRAWDGFGPAPKYDGNHEYIGIPIGIMSCTGYQIDIEEIQSNEKLSIPSQYSVVLRNT